eukprot:12841761-Ditylum_brightwellii.AAC.1
MGIGKDLIQVPKVRSRQRAKFLLGLSFDFSVGVFIFKQFGSIANWVVVCMMERGDSTSSSKFRGFVTDAAAQEPVLLSNQQTNDAINSISMDCGKNR